jgi:hypothetical protein
MSKNDDAGSDRRRILAAAAAAAAVVAPLAAKAEGIKPRKRGPSTRVQVELGGAHLPPPIAERLSSEITRACLAALHEAGYNASDAWLRPHPGWIGLWIDPQLVQRAEGEAQREQ